MHRYICLSFSIELGSRRLTFDWVEQVLRSCSRASLVHARHIIDQGGLQSGEEGFIMVHFVSHLVVEQCWLQELLVYSRVIKVIPYFVGLFDGVVRLWRHRVGDCSSSHVKTWVLTWHVSRQVCITLESCLPLRPRCNWWLICNVAPLTRIKPCTFVQEGNVYRLSQHRFLLHCLRKLAEINGCSKSGVAEVNATASW